MADPLDPTARTLRLLGLLEQRRFWPGTDLAARIGVSERTLRRDVQRLRDLGYPVDAVPGVGGGYQLGAGAALPPLVLDDDEAVALVVGLHANAAQADAGVAEASVRALAKTLTLLPARLRRRADALRASTVHEVWRDPTAALSPDVLDTVAGACHDTVRLGFAYTAADGTASARYVEPHQLVVVERRWYLVAFDIDRDDWRTFRVDRVTEPRATVARFDRRTLPDDPVAFVRAGFERQSHGYAVVADVALAADVVTAKIGRWVTAEPLGPGRCRVHTVAEHLDWPAFALLQLHADFVVHEPPELVDLVAEVGHRFVAATAGVAAGPVG